MKNLICVTTAFFCLYVSSQAQLRIIEDRFDYENVAFDLILQNTSKDTVVIDNVGIHYNWIKVYPSIIQDSTGGSQTIKPTAKYAITIPTEGTGLVMEDLTTPLICPGQQTIRIQIGIETHAEALEKTLYYGLELAPIITFDQQDTLSLWKRLFEKDDFDFLMENSLAAQSASNFGDSPQIHSVPFSKTASVNDLYKSPIPTDSLQEIYATLLSDPSDSIRTAAVKGINRLGFRRFAETVAANLAETPSLAEAQQCMEALYYFDFPYHDILTQRLREGQISSELVGLFALELGKMQTRDAVLDVFRFLKSEDLTNEDYDKVALGFHLLKDASHNRLLLELMEEKREWIYSGKASLAHQFSQLLSLALLSNDTDLFVPVIKDNLGQQLIPTEIIHQFFEMGTLLYEEEKGDEVYHRLNYNRLFEDDYGGSDYSFFKDDHIFKICFRFDRRYHREYFYYAHVNNVWLESLKSIYPAYGRHDSPYIRYYALVLSDFFTQDKSVLEPHLAIALQDSVSLVRKLSAQIIAKHPKRAFRSQVLENLGKASDNIEVGYYCDYLAEECDRHLRKQLAKSQEMEARNLQAILGFLSGQDSLEKAQFLPYYEPILKNYPDDYTRRLAFRLILSSIDQESETIKPFVAIALEDSSKTVRREAEQILDRLAISGFEELAIARLKDDHFRSRMSLYLRYLGKLAIPPMKEILRDTTIDLELAQEYIDNIRYEIPIENWVDLERELESWFHRTSGHELRAITLLMLQRLKKPRQLIPLLEIALKDQNTIIRGIAAQYIQRYPKNTFENLILDRLQDTLASSYEIKYYIRYLKEDAQATLVDIWHNPARGDKTKAKYLTAIAENRYLINSNPFVDAFDYFYQKKEIVDQVFALDHLFFLINDNAIKVNRLSEALSHPNQRLRETAAKVADHYNVEGVEGLIANNLLNTESSKKEIYHYLSYLGNDARPLLQDIFAAEKDVKKLLPYLEGLVANFSVIQLSPFGKVFQQYANSEDSYQKMIGNALLYLSLVQGSSITKANALLIQNQNIPNALFYAASGKENAAKAVLYDMALTAKMEIHPHTPNQNINFEASMAEDYGSTAWYYLFAKAFNKAEKAAKRGLELDPTQTWIYSNYALALLYQGKYETAKEMYLKYKNQFNSHDQKFLGVFLQDFDDLEAAGVTHPDVEKIRALLKD